MLARNINANMSHRPAASVNLIGGQLCLDFINSVGARRVDESNAVIIRDEKLNDCGDLIAWARHANALSDADGRLLNGLARSRPAEARGIYRAALELREALYRIFHAVVHHRLADPRDLSLLNRWIERSRRARHIDMRGRQFQWRWKRSPVTFEHILWLVSESAAELLTRGDLSRLRQCGGDDCGWIFEDTTRNRSRRWCDTGDCGNRDRVRRFRRHQRRRARVGAGRA